ncbi:MAG: DNA alkylation repair protein [Candidatus Krumholzibacteria bacterium]|nr:DNA alkylation repair protein [Candidatus Krumholzibacteria bacterium]
MKSAHAYHEEILREIEKVAAREKVPLKKDGFRYVGTTKPGYFLRAAAIREIFSGFSKRHRDLSTAEFGKLLDSLSLGRTYDEFIAIGLLLGAYPKLRRLLDPLCMNGWLEHAQGWAEVDVICQSSFTADEVLSDWKTWKTLLGALAESENVHKRRASLVLLTKPLRESNDPRLARMAFANADKLKHGKDILVIKALSWILRSLIKYHRAEVEAYLDANADTLPKIAIRETRYKLVGGVKRKTSQRTSPT